MRRPDRKSTRLNSSHSQISYAVFCLKKKNKQQHEHLTFYILNPSPAKHRPLPHDVVNLSVPFGVSLSHVLFALYAFIQHPLLEPVVYSDDGSLSEDCIAIRRTILRIDLCITHGYCSLWCVSRDRVNSYNL